MIIDGIEYALRFWVEDEDGALVCDEVFSSFDEMNVFLKAARHDEKYDGLTAQFSPVEVINGQPDESVRFIYEICPIMDLEPDEIEDFYYDIESDFQASKEMGKEFGKNTLFVPREDADDYESKKKHRNEFTYICPFCFREIDDCRCSCYSYYLVQIDTLLVPVIRTLNQKGYITTACCSGHIEENHCVKIYIAFVQQFLSYYSPEAYVCNQLSYRNMSPYCSWMLKLVNLESEPFNYFDYMDIIMPNKDVSKGLNFDQYYYLCSTECIKWDYHTCLAYIVYPQRKHYWGFGGDNYPHDEQCKLGGIRNVLLRMSELLSQN